MRSLILGFVAGAALLQNQAALPAAGWLLALLLFSLFVPLLARRWRQPVARGVLLMSAGAAIGFSWAGLFAQQYLSAELPKAWEGRDITLVGTIDSLPYYFEQGVRFNFAVERIVAADTQEGEALPALPGRLSLSWYSTFRAEELQAVGKVRPGERWQLTVRLRRPHGNANPFGFDYEVWLLEQGLRATGYIRPDQRSVLKNERLEEFVPGFGNAVERSRAWLRDRIHDALPDKPYAGVIVALVIGDQRAIGQSDWKVFNRTGVGHLISISGLHITMISGLFAAAILALWRRSFFTRASLPLILPAQKAAALAGAAMAVVYVLLAGFGVPAQRTLYMLTVVAAAVWFGRITSVSHVLSAALGIVILLDPWAVLWPGFWLSFGAVAIILFASSGRTQGFAEPSARTGWKSGLKEATHTQYVVTIGLIPMTMLLFGQFSIVGPIANAVAIPLISFLVTPMSLVGSVLPAPLSGWILVAAHTLVEWLAWILQWLSDSPVAVWSAPLPPAWLFAAALAGTLWLLAPKGWPVRWLGFAGVLPLLLHAPSHPKEGEMWVTAFDVGQGTALLVETANRRLLYDTGPAYSPDSDGGNRVILPYLKARGITALDAMIVSHSDNDHSGGALSILEEIKVASVYSSLPDGHPITEKAATHTRCEAGQSWTWDEASFDMLHPGPDIYESTKWKPNARSCTLKITIGGRSILLPGDIESPQEAALLENAPENLRADVLVAPHHGSGTSSTPAFLHAVQPEIALFQVGYRNRYRHPKAEVFERYGRLGIQRIRSDDSGAVTLHFNGRLDVSEYRSAHARYWYGR
ncbi:DNA internalization-related competence protein ComEC/Rec2 [Noviherbaspirillum denitrificans]|uniref:Competence protein ComEC n=1 Tax=Noviherbaspirillum denitrificans TaxID=1968433 RepID=A0A254TIU2_9BURK|nr:DNA internalization-related competence protein ComEC/Rec2 [Noviherbaspirillum denitrificans]OWW22415.1 competence protein ComEC [Noviherbaspirillum denitrificans]